MLSKIRLSCCLALSFTLIASVPAKGQGKRDDYVSDPSFVVGTFKPTVKERTPAAMAEAANKFLSTLSDEQKSKLVHEIDSSERQQWTNLPARADAGGLRLGDCTKEQVEAACQMMATMFSEHGYKKMCSIMLADDQLLRNGQPRQGFGTVDFSIVVFGTPDAEKPWSFQIDGHHLGVNLAIEGEKLTLSPSFVGTQPHKFSLASDTYVPMSKETELAHKLVNALPEETREKAVISNRRGNLRLGPGHDFEKPEPRGVACKAFDDQQKKIVVELISEWVNFLPEKQATQRMKEIESELDSIHFAWSGDTPAGSDMSYALQGPSLVIEYACQGMGGNPLDHLHSVYRNPKNEYGGQIK